MTDLLNHHSSNDLLHTARAIEPPLDHTLAGTPGSPSDWRMLMVDDTLVGVGGAGEVFGTSETQFVLVLEVSGTVSLDNSFNQGGDFLVFGSDAADWDIALSGSNAILSNEITYVQVPVGPSGMIVQFEDGQRILRYDPGIQEVLIGDQIVDADFTIVTGAAETTDAEPQFDVSPNSVGRVLMNEEGQIYLLGFFDIFGTQQRETIFLLNGEFDLDPSFNQGGDTIVVPFNIDTFEVSRTGTVVTLENDSLLIEIPAGPGVTEFSFGDIDEVPLFIDTSQGAVLFGTQEVTDTPMILMG